MKRKKVLLPLNDIICKLLALLILLMPQQGLSAPSSSSWTPGALWLTQAPAMHNTRLTIDIIHEASFYGSSFVNLPMQDARSSTDIRFRFRTGRAESMLMLAAGKVDYCLVMMQNGMIKVHINLGAGESELSSPRGLRLDDLKWHEVSIERRDADMQLTVDRIHTTRVHLPGRFYELNVHFGVLVGGMGNFNEIFLGNQEYFRGCMENVFYNGINVLAKAEASTQLSGEARAEVVGLTDDCSNEFDASSEVVISFVDKVSYISFPNWISKTGAMIKMKVKTHSTSGVLFYNTGPSANKDFVALEIWNGAPRLMVDQGNGVVELVSQEILSDGQWHEIRAHFNPTYMELTVDGKSETLRPASGQKKHIDLTGLLYFGGMDPKRADRAMEQGLRSASSPSIEGCMDDLELDGRRIGLPEVTNTRGIRSGCVWSFPCVEGPKKCAGNGQCVQVGTGSYDCKCLDGQDCSAKDVEPDDLDLVTLKSLEVETGGRALITSDNLRVSFDFNQYGIHESGVLFHVIEPPLHGSLDVSVWTSSGDNIFTLMDLNTDKVHYVHDGSNTVSDKLVLEIEFSPTKASLPSQLLMRQRFLFPIHIVQPSEDKNNNNQDIKVRLSEKAKIVLASGTELELDPDLFQWDPSVSPLDIDFQVISPSAYGFLRNVRLSKEEPIEHFTMADLTSGDIFYVDRGEVSESTLRLRVGQRDLVLPVETFALSLVEVNNTGIFLPLGSSELITPVNLTFISNAPEQSINVRFDIQSGPRYGQIERLRGDGRWTPSRRFNSRQLERQKVRYVHQRGSPSKDKFTFTVSPDFDNLDHKAYGNAKEYDFDITFITSLVKAVRNIPVRLTTIRETVITDTYLMYQTFPESSMDSEIVYSIVNPPEKGMLLLSNPANGDQPVKLTQGSMFTQVDLLSGHLTYKLLRKSYEPFEESFTFTVSTPKLKSATQIFRLSHVPGDGEVDIMLERLEVEEGGKKTITEKYLNVKAKNVRHFLYNVTRTPRHGWLDVLASNKIDVNRHNATFFTSDELRNDLLVYHHDDSESRRDSWHFLVFSTDDVTRHSRDFQYLAVFHIHVILRNDQTPTRLVDKVFEVVDGDQKLLTGDDLRFVDLDIDTKPEDIKYSHHSIPNGEIVFVDNPVQPIFQFTQRDLDDRQVLFKHKGAKFGRVMLWVSDGQYFVSTELMVRASDPFVKVTNNTGVIVRVGESEFVNWANLSIETNLDVMDAGIIVHVEEGPKYGKIFVDDMPVEEFTVKDLKSGLVEYRNRAMNTIDSEVTILNDVTKFTVTGESNSKKSAQVSGQMTFHIFSESYWHPLEIVSNNSLLVEESTSIAITQKDLMIKSVGSDIPIDPKDIIYMVQTPPSYGYLEIDPPLTDDHLQSYMQTTEVPKELMGYSPNAYEVTVFDQSIINEGRLHYIQSISNQSSDSFRFHVTNGISQLPDLVFHFTILPKTLYIETRELVVTEGKSVVLLPTNLHVITSYYEDKIEDYLIVDPPTSGKLVSTDPRSRDEPLNIFSVSDLESKTVTYVHDGNDTLRDEITLVGRTSSKTSVPTRLQIRVIPVNDETPKLVNNSGLNVWAGSEVTLTNDHLAALDADSDASRVIFQATTGPDCGLFAKTKRPNLPIDKFSMEDILNRQIIFRHRGGRNCFVRFSLTDGLNSAQPFQFRIQIRDVMIHLVRNSALDVFPMMQTPITMDQLLVTPNDLDETRDIRFEIRRAPLHGRILARGDDGMPREVKNFTQSMVNASRVFYEHNNPFSNLTLYDSMNLEAASEFAAQSLDITFHIRISVTAMIPGGGMERYMGLEPITVEEGGNSVLQSRNLNTTGVLEFLRLHQMQGGIGSPGRGSVRTPSVRLQLAKVPEHGVIVMGGKQARAGDTFEQMDIDRRLISYHHDHSDSLEDHFIVAVFLESDSYLTDKAVLLVNAVVNVSVVPLNDQTFKLMIDNPGMTIVQRQSRIITNDFLRTEDPDNPPREIVYDVINSPTSGKLVMESDLNKDIIRFTQEDINEERVIYVHDGSLKPADFYFRVSDGAFQPIYRHFRIMVIPLELKVINQSAIQIQQGTRMAYITSDNMGVLTNGQRSLTYYNITRKPSTGEIYLNDAPASAFSQINIDNEEVIFMQSNMSEPEDSFLCTVSNQDVVIRDQKFRIEVSPLIRREENFVAQIEKKTPILQIHLDATRLSGLTNSIPVYQIRTPPKFGQIMRIVRSTRRHKRAIRDKEVNQFTHEDVKNEVIYYVPDKEKLRHVENGVRDSFAFRLIAPGVQPANGVFKFTVVSEKSLKEHGPVGMINIDEDEGKVEKASHPSVVLSGDLLIALAVIAAIIILILFALVTIRCHRGCAHQHQKGHQTPHMTSVETLSTHQTSFGNATTAGGTLKLGNGHVREGYENGTLLSSSSRHQLNNYSHHSLHRHHDQLPYPQMRSNGTLSKRHLTTQGLTSDSDSLLESSRSRDTSPSSSIPPGLPSFRVIPLPDSNAPDPLMAFPSFANTNGTYGSDFGSDRMNNYAPFSRPNGSSDAGSSDLIWTNSELNNHSGTLGKSGHNQSNDAASSTMSNGSQPLLRRNQYWV